LLKAGVDICFRYKYTKKGNCCFRLKDLENNNGGEKTKTTEEANPTNPEHEMSVWLARGAK